MKTFKEYTNDDTEPGIIKILKLDRLRIMFDFFEIPTHTFYIYKNRIVIDYTKRSNSDIFYITNLKEINQYMNPTLSLIKIIKKNFLLRYTPIVTSHSGNNLKRMYVTLGL